MILTVAILLAGAGTGYAQSQDANSRKMARKQMKAEQDARDRLAFEEARKAIEAKEFVLEADQVSFKSGSTAQVSSIPISSPCRATRPSCRWLSTSP